MIECRAWRQVSLFVDVCFMPSGLLPKRVPIAGVWKWYLRFGCGPAALYFILICIYLFTLLDLPLYPVHCEKK